MKNERGERESAPCTSDFALYCNFFTRLTHCAAVAAGVAAANENLIVRIVCMCARAALLKQSRCARARGRKLMHVVYLGALRAHTSIITFERRIINGRTIPLPRGESGEH